MKGLLSTVYFNNIKEATLGCSVHTDHTYLKGVSPAILTFQNPDENQEANKVSKS